MAETQLGVVIFSRPLLCKYN